MPKEMVLSSGFNEDVTRGLRTEVRWSRDGYVQVATVADEMPAASGTGSGEGWFVDLDRKGCNDLIRHLRRARDQAFGRDE